MANNLLKKTVRHPSELGCIDREFEKILLQCPLKNHSS